MAEHHRLLVRQIRRHLKGRSTEGLDAFFDAISGTYQDSDAERVMLQRSLELSSAEILQANVEMQAIFSSLPDEFVLLDADGRILDYKSGSSPSPFFMPESPVSTHLQEHLPDRIMASFRSAIDEVVASGAVCCFEFSHRSTPEDLRAFEGRVFPLHEGRLVALLRDISERKRAEARISHLAYHDSLTGLPNRLMFNENLSEVLNRAAAADQKAGVLVVDVDRFKSINDTFGHSLGDALLVAVAERLRRSVRSTDLVVGVTEVASPIIARLGGDEFTIVLSGLTGVDDGEVVCRRLVESMAKPMMVEGREIFTSISVGMALFPDHGREPGELVANADSAMYHAKRAGRNTHQLYFPSMNEHSRDRMSLENDLRRAAEGGQLSLHYQPLVDAQSGEVSSLEALIRWIHPTRGFISPGVFIPMAEESDLVLEVGEWVVNEACRQIRAWLDTGFEPPRVSINLSSRQFWRRDVVTLVREALEHHRVDSAWLGIELTETAMVQNTERSAEALAALRAMGVRISLDDFGTGYSSLGYLKRFAVDVLKIDGAFVRDIITDQEDAALIRAIIAMGHSLGLDVVAECVETADQLAYLQAHGCDLIQGWLVCKPVPAEALRTFTVEQRARVARSQWPPLKAAG